MITKGGLNAVTLSLASEYATRNIRFDAVAPGIVDTPMHKNDPEDILKSLSPMGTITDPKDIAEAVIYLTEAGHVTGEVLHVDGRCARRPVVSTAGSQLGGAERRLQDLGIQLPPFPYEVSAPDILLA